MTSPAVLATQRRMTQGFINSDPTDIVLIPRVKALSAAGSATYTDGAPRPTQRGKLSLLAFDQRPTITLAGVERLADYHLILPYNAQAAVDDYWEDEAGTRFDVVAETEGWEYMRKFIVVRTIPREAKP